MKQLVDRLTSVNPAWSEWDQLIGLVKSLTFETVRDAHLGTFYVSNQPLVFADPADRSPWPAWLPAYVPALFGMKADEWEMAGGYADSYCNTLSVKGAVFSPAGNDEQLGFPIFEVPQDVFYFQSSSSGALLFVNKKLEILFPGVTHGCLRKLDTLEAFTRKNITQAMVGAPWTEAYHDLEWSLVD